MQNIFKVKCKFDLRKLILSIVISEGVGLISSLFTMQAVSTYKNLVQPNFAPPPWLFGPAWTLLYLLMGIASYRIWMYGTKRQEVRDALFYYGIQLFLNFLWSVIFFGLDLRGFAFLEIIILLLSIIITTGKFYRIDKPSGLIMIPYIAWVAFAALLNYSIWILNR